jgi:hypothetical protein
MYAVTLRPVSITTIPMARSAAPPFSRIVDLIVLFPSACLARLRVVSVSLAYPAIGTMILIRNIFL